MSANIVKTLRKQIDHFYKTGKLPKERDVVRRPKFMVDEEISGLSNMADRYKSSEEAKVLWDSMPEIIGSLSEFSKKVYNLAMAGGLSQEQTAEILGTHPTTVARVMDKIRKKASRIMKKLC